MCSIVKMGGLVSHSWREVADVKKKKKESTTTGLKELVTWKSPKQRILVGQAKGQSEPGGCPEAENVSLDVTKADHEDSNPIHKTLWAWASIPSLQCYNVLGYSKYPSWVATEPKWLNLLSLAWCSADQWITDLRGKHVKMAVVNLAIWCSTDQRWVEENLTPVRVALLQHIFYIF